MVRYPWINRLPSALTWWLLTPRSRFRRVALTRALRSGWDAANRRDWQLMLVRYAPNCEVEFASDFAALGFAGTFRGHDGLLESTRTFDEAFEGRAFFPEFVIDVGDRVLALGRVRLPGTTSGVEFEREFAQSMVTARGLVAREQRFLSWDEALRAGGLDPANVDLPAPQISATGVRQANKHSRSRA